MDVNTPKDARPLARVLLLDDANRILLLQGRSPRGETFWVMPGGGLNENESFVDAAYRELFEETGIRA